MSAASFALVLAGVLLNAAAQLLLKAGTNAMPLGLRLALEPHILGGLACYAVSVVVWIDRAFARAGEHRLSRCSRSATSSTRSPRGSCSARRSRRCGSAGIGVIIVGVFLVARS